MTAWLGVGGNVALACALLWPAREVRVPSPGASKLDEIIPVFQFVERHEIDVAATPEAIDRAIRNVTADEIRMLQTLTAWRRRFPGGANEEPILDPPARKPILETALSGNFHVLSDEPGREIVLGSAVIAPKGRTAVVAALRSGLEPGYARAIMNFRIEPKSDGSKACRLTTETRVHGTDAATARQFSRYWRTIYWGSSIIRHYWLEAIARRATT